jgi:hypothetical protein
MVRREQWSREVAIACRTFRFRASGFPYKVIGQFVFGAKAFTELLYLVVLFAIGHVTTG